MHPPQKKPSKQSRITEKATDASGALRHYAEKTGKHGGLRSFFHELMNVPGCSEHLLIL